MPVVLTNSQRTSSEESGTGQLDDIDIVADPRAPDPVQLAHSRDLKEMVTRGLDRREQLLVVLYYYEQMTMKEIGQTLDLSESRVSQMHSDVLQHVRWRLATTTSTTSTWPPNAPMS